ncbi:MAG: hypothetical protein JRI69_12045 [Deltaproteobacteria bacterium]|nr:hypothetical protein [Deltaproteobacteria bacterium]MBW2089637.1 hypothetical protein [Deltaproteobacteria bacterium]
MYSPKKEHEAIKERTINLSKKIIKVYSKKYMEPFYLDVKAFPDKHKKTCPYVAKWQFPNEVLIEVYVCYVVDGNFGLYYLFISTTDQKEHYKIKEEEREILKRKKEQEIKELKKTQDLL